jgi:hypothetical protein
MKKMNKVLLAVLTIGILLNLCSCYVFGPADGVFRVSGTIVSEAGKPLNNCSLELQDKKGVPTLNGTLPTKSEIKHLFVVAPYKADYWLLLTCPDYYSKKIPVSYGKAVSPAKPLDLGRIEMKKEKDDITR